MMLGLSLTPNWPVVAGPVTWQAKVPSCPPATRASVELPFGPQPLRFVSNDGFVHKFVTAFTVIAVVAEPLVAFVAVNVTVYGAARAALAAGVQVRVPAVREAFGVNTALLPDGSPVRSAASVVIASPSGSDTVTATVTCWPTMVDAAAGAVTIGARSVFVIVITVTALPDRVFEAVNVTVSEPASL